MRLTRRRVLNPFPPLPYVPGINCRSATSWIPKDWSQITSACYTRSNRWRRETFASNCTGNLSLVFSRLPQARFPFSIQGAKHHCYILWSRVDASLCSGNESRINKYMYTYFVFAVPFTYKWNRCRFVLIILGLRVPLPESLLNDSLDSEEDNSQDKMVSRSRHSTAALRPVARICSRSNSGIKMGPARVVDSLRRTRAAASPTAGYTAESIIR